MSNEFIAFDPNLVDQDRGQDILVLCSVFSILIVLSTASRIATKLCTKIQLGPSDYLILVSLVFNLTANILEIQAVQQGFGRHLQFLNREQVLTIKRLTQYNILFANISLWAVKISICFFILALVQSVHRRGKWILHGLVVVTTIASTCQGILWGLQAKPLYKLWNPDVPGKVEGVKTLVSSIITFTAINSLTDLFYAISPVYFFGRLQMSLGRRLVVLGLTGSGLLVFASSIFRVAFDGDFYDPDSTWTLHRVFLCTVIERNLAEVIADLPATYSLLRDAHRKTQVLLSRGTRSSRQASDVCGNCGLEENSLSKANKRPQFNDDELFYNEEEIDLNDSHLPAENTFRIQETNIGMPACIVRALEQDSRHETLA